jgi:S-DNA-T family DNA segregation ATPase FtsK/SpoIIIE
MFFRKKKTRLTVVQRTPDSKPFVIPQIREKGSKSDYEKSRFVSPIFGSKAKDEVVIPPSIEADGDLDLRYDNFRTKPKLTKEDKIRIYGSEYHEFDMISGGNLNEALERQNKRTKRQMNDQYNNEDLIAKPIQEEIPKKKTTINDFFDEVEEPVEQEVKAVISEPVREEVKVEPIKEVVKKQKSVSDYQLPPLNLLHQPIKKVEDNSEWIQKQIDVLNRTFSEFGVGATVLRFTKGPTVTRYEITLDSGVNVKKITNLSDNIKMALAAKEIRIEAPIPGKRTVGIEVPNLKADVVPFYDIIKSDKFYNGSDPLQVGLGLDIDGNGVYTSITKMPHGLVAGATGSGKSVCINTVLISLLYQYSPEELKLMLIDPKMVELSAYNELPHLLTPVITDVKVATAGLKWAVEEMERRFLIFKDERVRDITSYNQKMALDNQIIMPYIVIVIDELADLMTVASSSVEEAIMRLTQKARACGMHMVIATQRPSTDVVKGTIKSNIPTRIAFMVSSYVDSMTIIDSAGADKLLGRGDMLFAESGKPQIRVQGAYISDDEIYAVTDFIRDQRDSEYLFSQDKLVQKASIDLDNDELLADVARYVVLMEECSINKISKEFKIGFNRAQKIVESLENMGVVSKNLGSKARDVLVSEEELNTVLGV